MTSPASCLSATRLHSFLGCVIAVCCLTAQTTLLWGQPANTPKATVEKSAETPPPAVPESQNKDHAAKFSAKQINETKNVAYVLLMGVIMMLVVLFAVVLLGGSWIRRIVRAPLPPVKRPDELWYLKNPAGPESNDSTETVIPPTHPEEH